MNTARQNGLRVVLDTNVYFSAFTNSRGPSYRIWRQALQGNYKLLISPAIVTELAGVLRLKAGWDDEQVLVSRLKSLIKAAEVVVPKFALSVVDDDEDDNRILECAVGGNASLIVSGDHHLQRLKSFRGIGILRPRDFLRTLG